MSQFWNGEVLAAPNLITVCVDESQASEISGRLYHGYRRRISSWRSWAGMYRKQRHMRRGNCWCSRH